MRPKSMENLQERLIEHLEKIVIERNPYYASGGHLFAREYIRSHFSQFGEVITHEFEVNGNKHQNLILHIELILSNSDRRSSLALIMTMLQDVSAQMTMERALLYF